MGWIPSDSLHVVDDVWTNLLGFAAAEVQSSVSFKARICQKEWGELQVLVSVCLTLKPVVCRPGHFNSGMRRWHKIESCHK